MDWGVYRKQSTEWALTVFVLPKVTSYITSKNLCLKENILPERKNNFFKNRKSMFPISYACGCIFTTIFQSDCLNIWSK